MEYTDPSTQSISHTLALHLTQIEQRQNGTFQCTSTGLQELDQILDGGLQNGGLYLVAGRPATGKTALALNVGLNILQSQRPVIIFAPQMEHLEVARRLVSVEGSIHLRSHEPYSPGFEYDENRSDFHWETFSAAANRVSTLPFVINNDARISPSKLRAASNQVQQAHGDMGLVILDSFEAMATATNARGNKLQDLMSEMKKIAVDLNVPIIVSSLLHRSIESRSDRRPMLTDLTPGIETPADVVILLYRDEMYHLDSPDQGTLELLIAKNRWGQRGLLRKNFSDEHATIASPSLG